MRISVTAVFAALIVLGLAGPVLAASELRILARIGSISPELLGKFERETNLSAILDEAPDHSAMVAKLAGGHSGYDITFPPDHQVMGLIEHGLLERIWADRLPGFWNIEDPWRSRSFDPRNEFTIPHQWGTTAFAVDTSVHKGDIDTLRLLFDPPPDILGHIKIMDDADMVQLALLYLGEPRCTLDDAKLEKAARQLSPLLAATPPVQSAGMAQSLGRADVVLAVTRNGDAMRAREGRPTLAYAYPREGNLVWTDVIAIPRNPPNRANALKFLTFMLKPENAALQSNYNGYANMIRGSEAHMLPLVLGAPELVAPWPAKVGFLVSCRGEVQRRHETLWAELKSRTIDLGPRD
ncbi:spermidine/putrescine ABC transporter substrate-binding protein [Paramagnetospirillum kuznetsovii]|uniref:Spermidine/putrescine ABC transporter substrate-binding protein n=1 Tax=Paramagnetospirillum kuznetsovii TaxID=2053833 RepID=A0A364P178_9PROT|nr:extracellular solute-binding protein [Paramagnetospirillum kuznetsovii]RAU23010.1 spermidine/putrescine ABC transporter substrate-binding protein [Paramagnetospirillum kuznetsovii]